MVIYKIHVILVNTTIPTVLIVLQGSISFAVDINYKLSLKNTYDTIQNLTRF